jgi:hypothetical protein
MHELVQEHVLANKLRHLDQPPIERDRPRRRARTPSCPLITDRDARDADVVLLREREQLRGQFTTRSIAKRGLERYVGGLAGVSAAVAEARPLTRNPGGVGLDKRRRVAPSTAARQRHADGTIA